VLSAPGYRTSRQTLTLAPNARHTLTLALEKVPLAQPGQPWTVPSLGLTLLPVAAGSFAMGTIVGEPPVIPITQVTLTKPYWLGRTEVTQREWRALMDTTPSRFAGDELPVENITWTDAMEFCRRLTAREQAADRLPSGYVYSLPTEAQWENAWRAGQPDAPAAPSAATAWHEKNSAATTHPVATLPPNAWGFHDLQGNVWEWCADRYHAKLTGGTVKDPKGPNGGTTRVRRGGSYVLPPSAFRAPPRGNGEEDHRTHNLGFRLALVPKL
jgi:formylglycine-generating enzyme required for sulfatase activity